MGILLVRHADAIAGGADLDDAARWLTQEGRARARAVGAQVQQRGLRFARFLSSPRVRAVQTAELFAEALGFAGAIEIVPALSFTLPAQRAADALTAALPAHVAAFGHMPTLAETAALLCQGEAPTALAPSQALWIDGRKLQWSASAN